MAWKPDAYLLRGLLDNRRAGHVTGWLKFAGLPLLVIVDLAGDFEADVKGQRIRLFGPGDPRDPRARLALASFNPIQTGKVVRMTADRPAMTGRAYLEWQADHGAPVILDLDPYHVHVLGEPMLFSPGIVPGIPSSRYPFVGDLNENAPDRSAEAHFDHWQTPLAWPKPLLTVVLPAKMSINWPKVPPPSCGCKTCIYSDL